MEKVREKKQILQKVAELEITTSLLLIIIWTNIAAAFAKVKAHFMFRNVEVMAQLRDALTDKILIFGYLEQADTPFPIYTIICKYCNINRGRAFSIDVSVFE